MCWTLLLLLSCGPKTTPAPAATPPTPSETRQALERGDFGKARIGLEYGITVDPLNPEPYLLLARLYAGSTQPSWALLYGEAFLLLEPYSPRSAEISALLVTVHQRMARQAPVQSRDPFEAAFGDALVRALNTSGGRADLAGIVAWRAALPEALQEPDPIVDWHRRLQAAGHLEAYGWWLLRAGDPEAFAAWALHHESELRSLRNFLNDQAFQPGRDGLIGRPAHPSG
jgi:hypothetical protein